MDRSPNASAANGTRPSGCLIALAWLGAAFLFLIAALSTGVGARFKGCSLGSPGAFYFIAALEAGLALWVLVRPRWTRTLILPMCGLLGLALPTPRLLTARIPCNEEAAIVDLRQLISAQKRYASVNGGHYEGQLSCLVEPSRCIPGYKGPPEGFLMGDFPTSRSGYLRVFTPGPPPSPLPESASPTSVTAWACTAIPQDEPLSGIRGFCADSDGVLCKTDDGSRPPLTADSRCDLRACTRLD